MYTVIECNDETMVGQIFTQFSKSEWDRISDTTEEMPYDSNIYHACFERDGLMFTIEFGK